MAVTTLFILSTGCDDRFDTHGSNPSGEEKQVEVTLSIGLADEADGYELSGTPATKSRSDREAAFSFDLLPSAQTKAEAGTSLKPNALYNLEIRQYANDTDGTYKEGVAYDEVALGAKIGITLTEAEHCQLVLVAWGADNSRRLGTGNLSAVQDTIGSYLINDLKPEVQADMNKMPYVLHLKDVNVSKDGRIYSQDGEAIDIRLRLQRLAARLTFSWDYRVSGYTPQQILIHSIPRQYRVIASPDKKDNTYPSLLDQFTTIQLAKSTSTGSYSCWLPANVRGSNPAATSEAYRIKSNAPVGSSYIRFIAVKDNDDKKKLDYRIYLGGKETTDFNLYGNRDYTYEAKFNHSATELPVSDLRVTIVDPVPASEGNNNLVPTANCFMVAPGGAFCFNPYTYTVNGQPVENTLLQGWCDGTKIQSVRVLWQTLENGDVGDPVLGIVNSSTDHENIVDLKVGSSFTDARIYCRVAPNTTGGSGLIAAYASQDGSGDPLWSWHVWVTDYTPDARGNETVLEPENKRKQKYIGNGAADQYPMMDRNLGAVKGFVTLPDDPLEMSKASGFHYQGGRKDPFPSSYSNDIIYSVDFNQNSDIPPVGMLNLYGPDGITYIRHKGTTASAGYETLYKHPDYLYGGVSSTSWSGTSKTVHDPCPAGWRIPTQENYRALFDGDYISTQDVSSRFKAKGVSMDMKDYLVAGKGNGYLLYYDDSNHASYFRMSGYPPYYYQFRYIGTCGNLWVREDRKGFTYGCNVTNRNSISFCIGTSWGMSDAHTVRCIQEQN